MMDVGKKSLSAGCPGKFLPPVGSYARDKLPGRGISTIRAKNVIAHILQEKSHHFNDRSRMTIGFSFILLIFLKANFYKHGLNLFGINVALSAAKGIKNSP